MFLQDVSTMRRIVNVSNIKFGAPVTRNDKVVLGSEFLATTFRFLEAPSSQTTGQAAKPASGAQ
jgi:type IV pilus assembly protein PilO